MGAKKWPQPLSLIYDILKLSVAIRIRTCPGQSWARLRFTKGSPMSGGFFYELWLPERSGRGLSRDLLKKCAGTSVTAPKFKNLGKAGKPGVRKLTSAAHKAGLCSPGAYIRMEGGMPSMSVEILAAALPAAKSGALPLRTRPQIKNFHTLHIVGWGCHTTESDCLNGPPDYNHKAAQTIKFRISNMKHSP